jgi:hypothetical protein
MMRQNRAPEIVATPASQLAEDDNGARFVALLSCAVPFG